MEGMKQLLLRVPDETHRRLVAQASRAGRSLNALANEILVAAVDADLGDRRARLRARAAALGMLCRVTAVPVAPRRRQRILASTRGLGPVLEDILADERKRP